MRSALLIAALLVTSPAKAQDTLAVRTLHDAGALYVTIEDLSPSAIALGLDTVRLRTLVELHLREHGVPVVESLTKTSVTLYVNVNVLALSSGPAAADVYVGFEQGMLLHRNPQIYAVATTWHSANLIVAGSTGALRDRIEVAVTSVLDGFVNAWLTANPR